MKTTAMNAEVAKRVKALKINAKNEEEARKKLLEILEKNGIEGMDDEDTSTLLDIAESFVEDNASEEDENNSLAKEVEDEEEAEKKSKKSSKKVVEEDEDEETEDEEDEDEEETASEEDEFDSMDRNELKKFIKENDLDIAVKKSMTDDDIREAIRAAVEDEEESDNEDEDEDEEEDVKPAKNAKKAAPAAAPKKETVKKEEKPVAGKRGVKLDPKNNEDDRKFFAPLKKLFPESECVYAWVANAGVTIKHNGKNSQRSMVLIENCSLQADKSIKCNLYLLTFTKQTEILDEAGIGYSLCWSGAPFIKGITLEEAIEIITDLMEYIKGAVSKIDKKLGDNRKKMEENLEKNPAKKAVKKQVEEDEDEDEEEDVKPAKNAKKAAPAAKKKTTKK